MMFGMAATFALVALLDAGQQRFRWALIPAGILGVLGVVILLEAATWSNRVIAIVMVAAGLFLIYRGIRSHTEVNLAFSAYRAPACRHSRLAGRWPPPFVLCP